VAGSNRDRVNGASQQIAPVRRAKRPRQLNLTEAKQTVDGVY
jgi:hypothetical protein